MPTALNIKVYRQGPGQVVAILDREDESPVRGLGMDAPEAIHNLADTMIRLNISTRESSIGEQLDRFGYVQLDPATGKPVEG